MTKVSLVHRLKHFSALAAVLALGACTVAPPVGPRVAVMPPQGKDLQTFQQEDIGCRQYAQAQTGISPGNAAAQSQFNSAAVGTLLGAGLGAAIGAAAGNPGMGAAIGAGGGAVLGTAEGARAGAASASNIQAAYDTSYAQCMASRGNVVQTAAAYPPPAPPPQVYYAPPPPAYAYPYGYYYYPGYRYGGRHW